VLLLERQQEGRSKPCGGGMAASVQRWFPFDLSPVVDQVIRGVRFTWCLEDPVTAILPGDAPFWIVRRSALDAFLADAARSAGAAVHYGCGVEAIQRQSDLWCVRTEEGTKLRSPVVMIADGSSSPFASSLGLGPQHPRYASTVSLELEADVKEADIARFEFGLVHHGFCWAFPRKGGYSIGVGSFIGRGEVDPSAVLEAILPSLGLDGTGAQRRAGRLRVWNGHHRLDGNGLLVVGDAASLCDPFLAEGLRPSLMSGTYGAEAVNQWLQGDAGALAAYTARMRRQWGESMAWGKRIAQVFYRVPRVGYQLGVKRPTAPQRIAQILSGEMGYGDIAQRVIRRLLLKHG
jgi:flavin-dependent dehydrogenase